MLVHASDGALNWVGQMNQFGMIFWLLLSVYFLVLAATVESNRWGALWCVLSMVGVRLCLWSYESALGIVLLAPAIVLFARRRSLTRVRVAYALAYYIPALYYIRLSIARYVDGDGSTYQEGVLRPDDSIGPMLDDLAFNVESSLRFWAWDDQPPATGVWPVIVGLVGATIVVLGGIAVHRLHGRQEDAFPGRRSLTATALVGVVLLAASFPAYLLLDSARSLWRTQFLSGIGFGIALAAGVCLAMTFLAGRRFRSGAALVLTGLVAYFGVAASYGVGSFHYQVWDRHRDAIAAILEIAPRLEPKTVVVYTDVPRSADPFGDTLWFDWAIKLAYPGVEVVGEYFRDDGTPRPRRQPRVSAGPLDRDWRGGQSRSTRCDAVQHGVRRVRTARVTSPHDASQCLPHCEHGNRVSPETIDRAASAGRTSDQTLRAPRHRAGVPRFARAMSTTSKPRLLVFIVAYNAETTIDRVLTRIPASLGELYDTELLIIDDSSQDRTFERGESRKRDDDFPFDLTVLVNPRNQGYGGNQKIGFHYAIERGFDVVALVHGDGQYAPECLPDLVAPVAQDEAELVMGSRMLSGGARYRRDAPLQARSATAC